MLVVVCQSNRAIGNIPLCFVLCKDFSLSVVPDDLDINKTSEIQLLRPKHRHLGLIGVDGGNSLTLES